MILRLGYDIQFEIPSPVAMVALLNVHPSGLPICAHPMNCVWSPA